MTNNALMFSSEKMDWGTPRWLFDRLDSVFSFTLDAAASVGNAKCSAYWTQDDDGLVKPWTFSTWLNPPYGRGIGKWVEKARSEREYGCCSVLLLPSRTDTKWFPWDATSLLFIKGRLTFECARDAAPFPSVLALYGKHETCPTFGSLGDLGAVVFP